MSNREPILEVSDLSVGYGNVNAVSKLNMSMNKGDVVSVIGPNGAGKTTLLSALIGLLPSSGSIRYNGRIMASSLTVAQRVASGFCLVPETRELFAPMTVGTNLMLGAYTRKKDSKADIQRSLDQVYSLFPRLKERREQKAGTLSGGERQMVAMGRALMARPKLLMLDEPSLGLAPRVMNEILESLGGLAEDGVSILLVEQNARAALRSSDYGYVLENGQIAIEGPARALENDEKVIESYLGRRKVVTTEPSSNREVRAAGSLSSS